MLANCAVSSTREKLACFPTAVPKEPFVQTVRLGGVVPSPRGWAWKVSVALVALWTAAAASAATTYYAATTGSSGNSGLSASAPWTLSYALANAGSGNTVIVLPGTYSGDWELNYPLTLRSQTKWGARLINMPYGVIIAGGAGGSVVDGFEIAYSAREGVDIYAPNCTIRNCWIHDAGINSRPNNTAQSNAGVHSLKVDGTTVEYCLLENNGSTPGYDHGIYIAGNGLTIRGNVMRGNWGFGLHLYSYLGDPVNANVYDNLIYGNGYHSMNGWDGVWQVPKAGNTVSMWNNTIITQYGTPIQGGGGTLRLTNNIIIGPGGATINVGSQTVLADYTLSTARCTYPGPHDVVSSSLNFVNTSGGLYWLVGTSAARNKANPNIVASVDFFGNSQSAVTDIGAFQYNSAYAADSRVLDPSTSSGADYWKLLGGTSGGSSTIAISPSSQNFGTVLVGATADTTFTVQNPGTTSVSGSASVSPPFAIVSGSPYTLAAGQSQVVTVRFAPTAAGAATQSVSFTGGSGANATVTGTATLAPAGGFAFQASAGVLTAPFMVTNGYVCQLVDTENADGGRAVYKFTTSTAGVFVVSAVVNASNASHNSFYVTIDSTPTEPYNVWDIPVTSGFESRTVSWRGNGIGENDEFVPKAFALSAGAHSLIIGGREPDVQLQSLQLQPTTVVAPSSAPVLRLLPTP
jgi:hypothetical protein